MGKTIESTLVSLDGVIAGPYLWATEYFDREAERRALELRQRAMLCDGELIQSCPMQSISEAKWQRTV
jgi:hypothetical protein